MNKFGTSQNTGSIPASRQAADTRPEGLADIGNGGDVKEGSGRSVTSAPMCRSERPSPDPVTAFEEYWGASKYRSRNMIGYSDKKCLAWEAYSAALHSASMQQDWRLREPTPMPTHAYVAHPKYPWFCKDCGYPEHERLKHPEVKAS